MKIYIRLCWYAHRNKGRHRKDTSQSIVNLFSKRIWWTKHKYIPAKALKMQKLGMMVQYLLRVEDSELNAPKKSENINLTNFWTQKNCAKYTLDKNPLIFIIVNDDFFGFVWFRFEIRLMPFLFDPKLWILGDQTPEPTRSMRWYSIFLCFASFSYFFIVHYPSTLLHIVRKMFRP